MTRLCACGGDVCGEHKPDCAEREAEARGPKYPEGGTASDYVEYLLAKLAKAEQERDEAAERAIANAYAAKDAEARERELREALEWIGKHATEERVAYQARRVLQATQADTE